MNHQDRQVLIERIYDASEFPHSARCVYSNIYYGMADAMNMEVEDFRTFFPKLINPMYQGYKLDELKCAELNATMLEKCRNDILEGIANYVEYYANLDYDDGYDSV